MKIKDGQWVWWPREHPMPNELNLYESVLAHCRWHYGRPCPHQVLKSGRWVDVLIVGDMDPAPDPTGGAA